MGYLVSCIELHWIYSSCMFLRMNCDSSDVKGQRVFGSRVRKWYIFYKIFIVLLNHTFKPKWPVFAHVPFNIVHTVGTAATWYPQYYDQYVRLLTWLCRPLKWVKSESLRRWTRFSIPPQFVVLSFMNLNLYVNSVLERHTESATASERLEWHLSFIGAYICLRLMKGISKHLGIDVLAT